MTVFVAEFEDQNDKKKKHFQVNQLDEQKDQVEVISEMQYWNI